MLKEGLSMNNEEKILKVLESIQFQINGLESRFDGLESKFDGLESRFGGLESQIQENTQILKALEHNSQVHKAEIDKLNHKVTEVQDTIKNISNKIDENFSELKETNKSLLEMYGSHEAEIRTLRRKPV